MSVRLAESARDGVDSPPEPAQAYLHRPALPAIDEHTRRAWRRQREDHSAGGVAYRRSDHGELEVALIATHGGTRWQLPKGACEAGETAEETARREVQEEAGLETVNEGFLRAIDYWYWDTYRKTTPELVHKRVDFFLLRMTGGELCDASIEVDSVGWFSISHARDLLTFVGEREVLEDASARLARA
jgi:8-oxo-dGTP pyrophosphatase MutT (NUDIX family)